MQKILITGTAGFIGFHLAKLLIAEGFVVHGYNGVTDYYDVTPKRKRHSMLSQNSNFKADEGMLEDQETFDQVADAFAPDIIVHLAAQAGVRYSLVLIFMIFPPRCSDFSQFMDPGGDQIRLFINSSMPCSMAA